MDTTNQLSRTDGPVQNPSESAILLSRLLDAALARSDCSAGSIHCFDRETGVLRLRASIGIPATVVSKMSCIPIGKGLAGTAAARCRPVQLLDLRNDASGVATPGAKETGLGGAIALPIIVDAVLCGVFGVAKPMPYEFTSDDIAMLSGFASDAGQLLKQTEVPGKL